MLVMAPTIPLELPPFSFLFWCLKTIEHYCMNLKFYIVFLVDYVTHIVLLP